MVNPYRKLFNLFAFSLLSFAIYINFLRTDNNQLPDKAAVSYGHANTSTQQKSLSANDANKVPLAKVEKKD
jgi:hypothetical protein